MAINTRNKRFSMISMGRPSVIALPEPNGALDGGDRQQMVHRYRHLDADGTDGVSKGLGGAGSLMSSGRKYKGLASDAGLGHGGWMLEIIRTLKWPNLTTTSLTP